jgi:hypothetical protein
MSDLSRASSPARSSHLPGWQVVAVGFCVMCAALLRGWAAQGDIWLDEIWSINKARQCPSIWFIVTGLRYDNNHILNTIYQYCIGPQSNPVICRLLSIVTGVGAVALLGIAAARRGFTAMFATLWLAAFSYPLVLYSSEARGFAPAVFFALASFLLIQEYWRTRKLRTLALFWISAVLGFSSHMTYLFVYLGLCAWSVAGKARRNWRRPAFFGELAKCHVPPLLFLAFLYVVQVRDLIISGGPIYTKWQVVRSALLLSSGMGQAGFLGTAGAVAVAAAALYAIFQLRMEEPGERIFHLTALFLAPALVLLALRPRFFYFRYFLVCLPFLYLLLGGLLAQLSRVKVWGRPLCIALLLLFLAGNAYPIARLLIYGRGQYRAALLYMAERTAGAEIVVGSDKDERNKATLEFHADALPSGKRLVYVSQGSWPDGGPAWFILHCQDLNYRPPARLRVAQGEEYAFSREFAHEGTSGLRWFVYRNVKESAAGAPILHSTSRRESGKI